MVFTEFRKNFSTDTGPSEITLRSLLVEAGIVDFTPSPIVKMRAFTSTIDISGRFSLRIFSEGNPVSSGLTISNPPPGGSLMVLPTGPDPTWPDTYKIGIYNPQPVSGIFILVLIIES